MDEADGLAAEVLRSARGDGPSEAARRRAALALGLATTAGAAVAEAAMREAVSVAGGASSGAIGVATGATAVAAASATSASSAASAGAVLTVASAMATAGGSWGVGLLAAFVLSGVAGVAWLATDRPTTPTTPTTPVLDVRRMRDREVLDRAPAAVPSLAPASSPTSEAGPVDAAPGAPAPRTSPRRVLPPPPPVVLPPPSVAPPLALADEVQRLDRAKTALAAGEPAAALALLDDYDRDAPAGALRPEAHALRIDAVLATGDREVAVALARAFVGRYPEHHLRRRYTELAAGP